MILGTISTIDEDNGIQLLIDGEDTATIKKYSYIASYVPAVDDRVLIEEISGSYVILGRIITETAESGQANFATNATNAVNATNATNAVEANHATNSDSAEQANKATKADTATSATSAGSANVASALTYNAFTSTSLRNLITVTKEYSTGYVTDVSIGWGTNVITSINTSY